MDRRTLIKLAAAAPLSHVGLARQAAAQDRAPTRLVSGFAAGGTTDILCRILADALARELDTPFIVENKAGAGGRLAAEYVKNARPDGRTLLVGPDGWAIFPSAMYPPSTLRYDITRDLQPVAQLVSYPLALVVHSGVPARTLKDYAAWLKSHPDKASFGTPAPNGQLQFVGWQVGQVLGIPLEPIVYKGNAPMLLDLQSGQLPAAIMVSGDAIRQPRDKVRVLGLMASQRWPVAPDIPTFREQGVAIDVDEAWQGLWAPAGTPPATLERLEAGVRRVLQRPEVQQDILNKLVVSPQFQPGQTMERKIQDGLRIWKDVIRQSGYKPET